jgi:hypothetical protein
VVDDAAGTGDVDATWSADLLVSAFDTKADKIPGGTAGAIVVLDAGNPSNIADSGYIFGDTSGDVPRYVSDQTLAADAIKEITVAHGVDILGTLGGDAGLTVRTGVDAAAASVAWLHDDASIEGWVSTYTEDTATAVELQFSPVVGGAALAAIITFNYNAGTYLSTIKGDLDFSGGSIDLVTGQLYMINGAQHTHDGADITSGTIDAARLPGSWRAYEATFDNANLVGGVLSVTHGLSQKVVHVVVADNNFDVVVPDDVTFVNTTTTDIDLSSFAPITGTWTVRIIK